MKNVRIAVILVFVAIAGFFYVSTRKPVAKVVNVQTEKAMLPIVTVIIDDGDDVATQSGIGAGTALAALEHAASVSGLTVKTKEYDFGVLIEGIGVKQNSTDNAWIYYINGKSATQAASLQKLQTGDSVLWKYEPPQF